MSAASIPNEAPRHKLESTPISIQRILLATDFDEVTRAALHHSLAIARRYEARIYLMHVVRAESRSMFSGDYRRAMDDAWRDAQRHMTDLLIAGHLEGVDHQVLVERGETAEIILRKQDELFIDLLVVGTHGRSYLGKLLLGSVAETIFRQATCPVLMVGPKASADLPPSAPDRILFCTGFSAHSLKAGGYALSLAEHQKAQLILMHVSQEDPGSPQRRRQKVEESRQRLQGLIPADAQLASPPEFLVEFGNAADRILAVCAEKNPRLIVLGVRQPVGFSLRFKWATAYAVVSNAPCPVLTVRMSVPVP
jgi:nucleotide-binding universal stress UspA family protein